MNLHSIVSPVIGVVNPLIPITARISVGPSSPDASGNRVPQYATPGAFTGVIAGNELTVQAISSGVMMVGQTISGAGVAPSTMITALLTGTGGVGTYHVSREQTVASPTAMSSAHPLLAQVQPLTWRDLQQLDGINIEGIRWKAYLNGQVDGIVRPERKGGDLITIPAPNRHAGVWLVAQVLEQWPDWVVAAIVLQNQS